MPDAIPITDEAAERRKLIRDTWDRYDGEHPESLDASLADVNDNVALNNLATIVDTGADFLMGAGAGAVEWSVQDEDGVELAAAEEYLEAVWRRNRKRTLLRNTATSGAISGHFAIKIVPAGIDGELPRLILLDPLDLVIQSDPADIDKRIGYAIDTVMEDAFGRQIGRRREQHTIDEGGQSWTITWLVTDTPIELAGSGAKVKWIPDPQRPDPETWPHPFPAIIDGQNLPNPHREWGRADLSSDILHMQEAINRVASNEAKTLRHFAHPQPYAIAGDGSTPTQIQGFVDASIGMTICLPAGSSMGVLPVQHQGLAAASAYRESLTDKLFEVARTPRIAAGKVDGVGALSGVALLILYRPLIAKTETKRDTYGDALAELNARLLVLAGMIDATDAVEIVATWPEVLPKDTAGEVTIAAELRDLGVSLQTVLERIGINYEQELARIREEQADPMGDAHGLLTRIEEMQQRIDEANGVAESDPSRDVLEA